MERSRREVLLHARELIRLKVVTCLQDARLSRSPSRSTTTCANARKSMDTGHEDVNAIDLVEDARSASPTPPPPVETTPGPRATALQRLYADATTHVLKTCSYNTFAHCFPTPARARPESLKDLHAQFTTSLGKSMRANFDDILEERDVVRSLNELDRLINEAKKRRSQSGVEPGRSPSAA